MAAAVVAAIAIACVLVFVVFDDQIFKDEGVVSTTSTPAPTVPGGLESPEQVARALFQAMEDKNVDAFFALFDPAALKEFLGGLLASEEAREALSASMFDYGSIKFSDLEFSTVMKTATTATVSVTAGTAAITDLEGVTETKDATEAGQPVTFELIQRDGGWYVDPGAMLGGMGGT